MKARIDVLDTQTQCKTVPFFGFVEVEKMEKQVIIMVLGHNEKGLSRWHHL